MSSSAFSASVSRTKSLDHQSKRRLTKDFSSYHRVGSGSYQKGGPRHSITQCPPLFVDGIDVTPLRLNPYVYEGSKERPLNVQETQESFIMAPQSLVKAESQRFQATLLQQKQESLSMRKTSHLASSLRDDMLTSTSTMTHELEVRSSSTDVLLIDEAKSTGEKEAVEEKIPQHVELVLKETDTIFFLDLPSCTVPKNSEEATAAEEDNRTYDYLTKGKGRNRKVLNVGIQTLEILQKARDSETEKSRFRNRATYVSTWEMYDTLHKSEKVTEEEEEADDVVLEGKEKEDEQPEMFNTHQLNDEESLESFRLSPEDKQITKLVKSKAFFDALIVIERLLASNTYNEQQKVFKGLREIDNFFEGKVYKYKLELLWTYANDQTEGRCVTGMAFNSHNEDLVAVCYGKYYYMDRVSQGMVMIWNIKNPQQPERQYNFSTPVTCIAFSKLNPNTLAVGFYNGHILLIDVSQRDLLILRENRSISFEPVWSIVWLRQGDDEDVMASFGDGRVCKLQVGTSLKLKSIPIMTAAAAEGQLKGIKYLKKCESKDISVSRYEEARCLALHPVDSYTYYVGTSEGVVHRCSINYYNEHMDLFKAHDGAIHTMKFSPFANKLYYTCGDDFRTRLWVEGIHDPLVTSEPSILPVLDVDWSPSHPTVVASIRGSDVLVWDMQRKMYEPQSLTKTSKTVMNTVCRFTPNGRCLMVGDMSGTVRVYSLEDMPIAPFFPEQLVFKALKKLLVTKPELLRKLIKLGSLNFDVKHSSKYFT